jgi:hypothetical protein
LNPADSKRQSSHSPIHCNENENKKCELASLPFRPFLPKEKGNPFLSLPLFPGRSASGIQLLIDLKNRGKFKKKFALESARLFVSTPSNPPIHFSCVRKKNNRGIYFWGKISKCGCRPLIVQSHFLQFHSVDKLTQQQPK